MKIGVDVDGCLADFNAAFIDRVIEVTGIDKFPARPFDIPTWDYPQYYGYTEDEVAKVWDNIKGDELFWYKTNPYPDAIYAIQQLTELQVAEHDIYFITNRMGKRVKLQTEAWLMTPRTGLLPTVLISADKAACCNGLKLDFYIDDKTENCEQVKKHTDTNVLMMKQPWNKDVKGIPRIPNWEVFFESIKEVGEEIQ
jgi:uncharacterized HAD superfamily protein